MKNAGRAGAGRRRALRIAVVATGAVLAAPVGAQAVGRVVREHAGQNAAKPFFDSRVAPRRAGARVAASATERSARTQFRSRLGRESVVKIDPLTGTARTVQRLDGTLTGPAAGDRSDVGLGWVRANRAVLGLTAADVDGLTLADRTLAKGSGVTHLRYQQAFRGIPMFDNGLGVNLDRGGRILNVTGTPISALKVDSVVPRLNAVAAMRALQRDVGAERAIDVTSGPSGDRRVTRFSRGDFARLVIFGGADGPRLAWHLTYQATSLAYYDAVVDANTGGILFRQNLTKFDAAQTVFPNYPGAEEEPGPKGANNDSVDINFETEGWLTDETTLDGQFVHAFSDVNDDNVAQAAEEIERNDANADFPDAFDELDPPAGWANACDFTSPDPDGWPDPIATKARCSWDPTDENSWETNREQNGVQAFYLANVFHDHLERPEIGFDAADGNFEGADKVQVNTDDGADSTAAGGPDEDHLNNANMSTPPDGSPARMQMYLFTYDPDPDTFFTFRNINGGDDAATVWHEYTHGLSNRLITNADGSGAVSGPHAGAMGEAWSDWYALDLLHREGLEIDDPTVSGEVDIGVYSDAVFASTRFEPFDCPVDTAAPRCPGGFFTGPGGYTLGDFGRVAAALDANNDIVPIPEVHSDGEIWGQTLWDLRTALIDEADDEEVGSDAAEEMITEAMRLSPPEPSFLDMRNAILAADEAISGGANRDLVWSVFAARGMGFYAGVVDSSDTTPTESFAHPPAPGAPRGTTAGVVTSADTGLPLGSVTVGFGGLPDSLATTTGASGRYALSAPAGRYGDLIFQRGGYDRVTVPDVQVSAGTTRTQNAALRRDWAAKSGGGAVLVNNSLYDNTGAGFGCGLAQLIDQKQGAGWSPFNPTSADPENPHLGAPKAVIRLPQTVTITAFGLDPSSTCGDDPTATTKDYRIETSPDGVHFAVAKQGSFAAGAAGRLNIVAPTANATNVRFVRLTLLSPQRANPGDSGRDFIDFSEIEIFGGPRNVLPAGTLGVSATRVAPRTAVAFDASSFRDPDSKITGYSWDFDGNGSVDRTTTTPTTSFAYTRAGSYTAKVLVKDFRGGAGTATRGIRVTRRPSFRLPKRGTNGRARLRVTCEVRCTVRAKLRLGKRTVGSLRRTLRSPGTKRLTVKLTRKARRAIDRPRVKVRLVVSARYTDGRSRTARRTITLRL